MLTDSEKQLILTAIDEDKVLFSETLWGKEVNGEVLLWPAALVAQSRGYSFDTRDNKNSYHPHLNFEGVRLTHEQADEECMDIVDDIAGFLNIDSERTYLRRMSREKAKLFEVWRQ